MESEQSAQMGLGGDAFRRLVVPELPVLLRVARRLTGNLADAEDLVQETLVRAYRAIDRFDGRYPRAWLLTIQRNTWITCTAPASGCANGSSGAATTWG